MASDTRNIYLKWPENALKNRSATPSEVYRWIRANEVVPASEMTGSPNPKIKAALP